MLEVVCQTSRHLCVPTSELSSFHCQWQLCPFSNSAPSLAALKTKLMVSIFICGFCRHPYLYARYILQMKAYVKDWIKGNLMTEAVFTKGTSRKKWGGLTVHCSGLSPASLLNCNHWAGNWCSWEASACSLPESLPTFAETAGWDHWPGTLLQYGSPRGNIYTVLFKPESEQQTDVGMPTCVKDAKAINDHSTMSTLNSVTGVKMTNTDLHQYHLLVCWVASEAFQVRTNWAVS